MSLISVIVPIYNTRPYLRECIDSILNQTGVNLEIVLVNDGSEDGCGDICHEYADHYADKVIVMDTDRRGPSASRNTGLRLAHGEFIVFCDSDDVMLENALNVLYNLLKRNPTAGIAVGQIVANRSFSTASPITETVVNSKTAIRKTLYQEWSQQASACAKMYRRAIFSQSDEWFVPNRKYEDLEAFPRFYMAAEYIAVTSAAVYYYRRNSESILHRWTPDRTDALWATERIEEYVLQCLPEAVPAAMSRRFSAAYNMFILANRNHDTGICKKCWEIIRKYRTQMLSDKNVRLRNKIGALVSFLGPRAIAFAIRLSKD